MTAVDPAPDLLAATPKTAYFWGRVVGDGAVEDDRVVVRASDDHAAETLAAVAGTSVRDHRTVERESAHDASVVRVEDEYELHVLGGIGRRAAAALGLPLGDQPGGYRLDAFADHPALLRGLLESCGTVCFRESAGAVGVSFVHDDRAALETVRGLLADADPHLPTEDLSETSSGGHWFGLADDADHAAFAEWVYADAGQLYATDRRRKLQRSVERATDQPVGGLS